MKISLKVYHKTSILNTILDNIKKLRKECNMKTIEVIAKLQCENVNVTTGIFSKVENGYNNPTVDIQSLIFMTLF